MANADWKQEVAQQEGARVAEQALTLALEERDAANSLAECARGTQMDAAGLSVVRQLIQSRAHHKDQARQALDAIRGLLANASGCPFCDSGDYRDFTKKREEWVPCNQEDCAWYIASRLIATATANQPTEGQ